MGLGGTHNFAQVTGIRFLLGGTPNIPSQNQGFSLLNG